MKIFAYALREYDEKKYMDYFSDELGFEYSYTSDYPCLENAELANGYDAVSTINNQLSAELTVSDMVRTTVEGLLAFEKGGENPAEIPYED